jgi:hypothetical protein
MHPAPKRRIIAGYHNSLDFKSPIIEFLATSYVGCQMMPVAVKVDDITGNSNLYKDYLRTSFPKF